MPNNKYKREGGVAAVKGKEEEGEEMLGGVQHSRKCHA